MAVVREMAEEAGVLIDLERLDYLGSQPWPFPSSLMLGYRARVAAGSGEARPDGEEISELRWFTRASCSPAPRTAACASRRRSRSPGASSSTGTAPSSPAPGRAETRRRGRRAG